MWVNEAETRVIERKPWVFAVDMRVITADIQASATSRSPDPPLPSLCRDVGAGYRAALRRVSQLRPWLISVTRTAPITHGRRGDNPHNSSSTACESAQHVPSFGMSMWENDAKTRGIGRKPREIDAEVWVIAEGCVRVTPVPILRIARPCGQRHADSCGLSERPPPHTLQRAANVGYHRVSAGLQDALQVRMTNAKNVNQNG